MKKIILPFILIAGLHGTARAQGGDTSLGVKAGATYSAFAGKQAFDPEYIFGFHAGIFANIGITDMLAFQPELLYSQKGSNPNLTDFKTRLTYLDIPLSFHVNAGGLFFEAGPQVGLLLSAKDKPGNLVIDTKGRYNTFDFGYLAGLGYQRKQGLGIGLRYNGGFTKVEKSVVTGPVKVDNDIRNSAFQLYLTYSLNGR